MTYSTIALADVLEAMERNITLVIRAAGKNPGEVHAQPDTANKTASCRHSSGVDYHTGKPCVHVNVFFPVLPATTRLSRGEADRWTGYFLHEVSHALYTDEKAWQQACRKGIHKLVNALEDVRIERALIDAGLADNAKDVLTSLVDWCAARMTKKYDVNSSKSLPWTVAFLGRAYCNGYELRTARYWASKLGPAQKAAIFHALDALKLAKDTYDVIDIAEGLLGMNQPQQPQQPQEGDSEPGDGDMGDDWQDDEDLQEGETNGAAGDEDGEEGGSDDEGGAPGDMDDDGDQTGDLNPGEYEGPLATFDKDKMEDAELDPLSDRSKKAHKDLRNQGREELWGESVMLSILRAAKFNTLKQPKSIADAPRNRVTEGDTETGAATVRQNAQRAALIRSQAVKLLKASDDVLWTRGLPRGRLDRSAMGRIGAGNINDVFSRRRESEGFETEIIILCDGSGSMESDGKLMVTATLALAIAQAADQAGVACQVLQFDDGMYEVKAPRERCNALSVVRKFGIMAQTAWGGTSLTDAIAICANTLLARAPEKRKILFAITDGECKRGSRSVKAAAKYAASLGVDTVGLSIDSPCHGAFEHEVRVSAYDDVSRVGFGALMSVLERHAA